MTELYQHKALKCTEKECNKPAVLYWCGGIEHYEVVDSDGGWIELHENEVPNEAYWCTEHAMKKASYMMKLALEQKADRDTEVDDAFPCEFSGGYRCGNCANCHRSEGAGK